MTPIQVRRAAFDLERKDSLMSPHEAFLQGYLFALSYHKIPEETTTPISDTPLDIPLSEAPTFDIIWDLYDRKDNKQSALKAWNKLTGIERIRAYNHIHPYVKAHPEKKFRPMLSTYLNQKRFNDEEIITNAQPTQQQQRFAAYSAAIQGLSKSGK